MGEAWIVDGVRSPRGRGKETGALHPVHPQELLGQVLNALRDRVGFDPAEIDDVPCGNVSGTGDHAMVIGRMAILAAGWPVGTPGMTLNRFCGSGQQAVTLAAMGVAAGHQDLVIGSGVEMMSRWERERAPDFAAGNSSLRSMYPMVPQGVSADLIATLEGFSREACDAFAVESQRRTEVAQLEGRFDGSIVPIKKDDGSIALDRDEHPRAGTSLEALSKLEPSFAQLGQVISSPHFSQPFDEICLQVYPQLDRIEHVHHAGNSSGVVDGASAILVASPDYARAHGLQGRARVVTSSVTGAEPVIMLTAPGSASLKCLERAGMTKDDIDLWEINEAFASVPLKVIKDLDLDPERVNVNGGAIALGHPIGATGPMLIQTALDELERTDKTTALITMCTGGGMATASIIERI